MRMFMVLLSLLMPGVLAAQPLRLPAAAATPPAKVELIEGWQAEDGTHVAAIRIRLAPGWYTYWRVPGDAGIPPDFDWSGSGNIAGIRPEWPRPSVFDSYGIQAIGYAGELVLPVVLTPERPGAPVDVVLDLFFGVCDEICMPAEARIEARLAPGRPESGRATIEAARAERPRTAAEAGVRAVTCGLAAGADGPELVANVTFDGDPAPGKVMVIEPGQEGLRIGAARSQTQGHVVSARAPVRGGGAGGPAIDRSALRLTVIGPRRAIEIRGCAAPL